MAGTSLQHKDNKKLYCPKILKPKMQKPSKKQKNKKKQNYFTSSDPHHDIYTFYCINVMVR